MSSGAKSGNDLVAVLEQLRKRLLDLTARNRLLNFKHSPGKSLQFVEGEPAVIYQRLVEELRIIEIRSLPEPKRSEWMEQNGRPVRPDEKEWAQRKGISTGYDLPNKTTSNSNGGSEVRALYYSDDLAKHCRKLEREAKLAIEETGANMLFMVLGFLEYPDQRESEKKYLAPLICLPVEFKKRENRGQQVFSICSNGDEITENLSLREKLSVDHSLVIPELDEETIDVEKYFGKLEKLIKNRPGWQVRRRVSLCLLSFSNMLLLRDIDPATWPEFKGNNGLLDHETIGKIFGGVGGGTGGLAFAPEHPVEEGEGAAIPLVFDADSSQHSALIDALSEKDLVIEGPPGTGKSQTITNLIAASIARGKTVLFVAEKLAALEVVKTRLTQAGIAPFLLELHSNKANKKRFLEEIQKRIDFPSTRTDNIESKQKEVEHHRDALRTYADTVNTVYGNSFDLTVQQVIGRAEKHRLRISIDIGTLTSKMANDAGELSETEFSRRINALKHLSSQFKEIGGDFGVESPFWGFFPPSILSSDESQLRGILKNALQDFMRLKDDVITLLGLLQVGLLSLSHDTLHRYQKMLEEVRRVDGQQLPLHLIPRLFGKDISGEKAKTALQQLTKDIEEFNALEAIVLAGVVGDGMALSQPLAEIDSLNQALLQRGVSGKTLAELIGFAQDLESEVSKLHRAINQIGDFCKANDLPASQTKPLEDLCQLFANAPEEYLPLQRKELGDKGTYRALKELFKKQQEIGVMHNQLAETLYLDMSPEHEVIRRAVLVLREGDAWYRIFQPRWWDAEEVHKNLQKKKGKTPVETRLAELESLNQLLEKKRQWMNDPAWPRILGSALPATDDIALEGYLAVAEWIDRAKDVIENLNLTDFDIFKIDADAIRFLRRKFAHLEESTKLAKEAVEALRKLCGLAEIPPLQKLADDARSLSQQIQRLVNPLLPHAVPSATLEQCIAAMKARLRRVELLVSIKGNEVAQEALGSDFQNETTDTKGPIAVIAFGQHIQQMALDPAIKKFLVSDNPISQSTLMLDCFKRVSEGFKASEEFAAQLEAFGRFSMGDWATVTADEDIASFSAKLAGKTEMALQSPDKIVPWSHYIARRDEILNLHHDMKDFVALLERRQIPPDELGDAYGYCVFGGIARKLVSQFPQLSTFSGLKHGQVREEFARLDKEIIRSRGKAIARSARDTCAYHNPSYALGENGSRVDDKTEMHLVNYLLPQQRPRMPIRKILARAGKSIQALKPCFMMGPQAVAQFLTPGKIEFDLVIMDEASQLKPEEAIGAIARGRQLVVVGDPKQLPPTSFFQDGTLLGADDGAFATTDAESILDVCLSAFGASRRRLRWHYRSRHESLIAFSNHHFYNGDLIIFPSPYGKGKNLGVHATYLSDAVYRDQTNHKEAWRVVNAVVEHIISKPDESLGVVTLNIKQRDLIDELLDKRLQSLQEADTFRERWEKEGQGLFVKNLENVQGDERDAIIISTTFGKPDGVNRVRQNFGPISRRDGWRRLNVLFTRARKSVHLYTSLLPEDIVVDGTTPEGTKALRYYLEYARSGRLSADGSPTGREPDSDFEVAVIEVLKRHNYELTPQFGVAGYRIDIAVKHPEIAGIYLAAIECDGATYHSALSVRDRDRIRQEIIESQGWKGRIWRIWSTDWFRNPRGETERLIGFLENLRGNWKPEYAAGAGWVEEGASSDVELLVNEPEISDDSLILSGELEVRVGDLVTYVDLEKPEEKIVHRIINGKTDFPNGKIAASTPLAQTLLGAVREDEVILTETKPHRKFKILNIERDTSAE